MKARLADPVARWQLAVAFGSFALVVAAWGGRPFAWAVLGALLWLIAASVVALLLGRMIRLRDAQVPVDREPSVASARTGRNR